MDPRVCLKVTQRTYLQVDLGQLVTRALTFASIEGRDVIHNSLEVEDQGGADSQASRRRSGVSRLTPAYEYQYCFSGTQISTRESNVQALCRPEILLQYAERCNFK